ALCGEHPQAPLHIAVLNTDVDNGCEDRSHDASEDALKVDHSDSRDYRHVRRRVQYRLLVGRSFSLRFRAYEFTENRKSVNGQQQSPLAVVRLRAWCSWTREP